MIIAKSVIKRGIEGNVRKWPCKKIFVQKYGSAKTISGKKKWYGHSRTGRTADDGLDNWQFQPGCHYSIQLLNQLLNDKIDVPFGSDKIRRIQNIIEREEELRSSIILSVQNGMQNGDFTESWLIHILSFDSIIIYLIYPFIRKICAYTWVSVNSYTRGWTGGTTFSVPSPIPPLPSPVSPTSLPLLPHFPPPMRFFPPPDKMLFLFKNQSVCICKWRTKTSSP